MRAAARETAFTRRFAVCASALALIVVAALYADGAARAQSSDVGVAVFASHISGERITADNPIYVGDPFILTLSAIHPADSRVVFPRPSPDDWGAFEPRSWTLIPSVANEDGSVRSSVEIEAQLFEPGAHVTPPLTATILRFDGSEPVNRPARPAEVTVESILPDNDNELRDIKPQEEVPAPIPGALVEAATDRAGWIAGGAGALALAAALAILYRRRTPPEAVDPRSPARIALEELDRIESLALPAEGRFEEYYVLLADCLRRYLRDSFGVPASVMTTAEIMRSVEDAGLGEERSQDLRLIFFDCDLVKFATLLPGVEDAAYTLTAARRFVGDTSESRDAAEASR